MLNVEELKKQIINGYEITKEEAMQLLDVDLQELACAANEIRERVYGNGFDICTIINAKSGRCSENCRFCAQSSFYDTKVDTYSFLSTDEIVEQAKENDKKGVLRFSIVTSGKRLSDADIEKACDAIRKIKKDTNIQVCVSVGLQSKKQYAKLKEAGASRVHNNLETSEKNFPNVCTTHTFKEKLEAINAAKEAGLAVCSGGIVGLGETMEDRIDMAFSLREIGVKSVPINQLNPIPGTPFEKNDILSTADMQRIIAIYRFILPNAAIRLAGGRGIMEDKGKSCFLSGANATISGDMLTTAGITVETDMDLIHALGYEVKLCADA